MPEFHFSLRRSLFFGAVAFIVVNLAPVLLPGGGVFQLIGTAVANAILMFGFFMLGKAVALLEH